MTSNTGIPVTVVLRSYNDAALLPRTLAALDSQRGVIISLIVYESASTDQSPALLKAHGYAAIEHLPTGSYWSSSVLNAGVSRAQTDFVAFLNSDAVMMGDTCLRDLAGALIAEPRCAGTFARQTVRPKAGICTRLDYDTAFAHRDELGSDAHDCLSLVCSMIRRAAWEDIHFNEDLSYAEDFVWSQHARQRGWSTRYVPTALAEHSHEYTWNERYRRAFGDAAAMATVAQHQPSGLVRGMLIPWFTRCVRDTWRLCRYGSPWSAWRLPLYRWPLQLGAWHGAQAGWAHFRTSGNGGRQPLVPRTKI